MARKKDAKADPIELFNSAEDYFRGWRKLASSRVEYFRSIDHRSGQHTMPHEMQFVRSEFMLAAFSLELFLKGIHAARSGKTFPRGHELKELFGALDVSDRAFIEYIYSTAPEFQQKVRAYYRSLGMPSEFHSRLSVSSNAFAINRYSFEDDSPDMRWCGDDILQASRIFVFAAFPELTMELEEKI